MQNRKAPPGVTEELFARSLRLEDIFTPHIKEHRAPTKDGESATERPIKFVHYTSAESALKIIESKRLWMRNVSCMSDFMEVKHGIRIIKNFLSDKTKIRPFIEALEECSEGVVFEALAYFFNSTEEIESNTYITAFSDHAPTEDLYGRLSMWRAFGRSNAQVGIVVRIPTYAVEAPGLRVVLSPVTYMDEKAAHGAFSEIVGRIKQNRDYLRATPRRELYIWVFFMFLASAICLKHPGFAEEREYRVIRFPKLLPSTAMDDSQQIVVFNGIPQRIYLLPLDKSVSPVPSDLAFSQIVERLIIGPTSYPNVVQDILVEALTKAGCADAASRVVVSDIPLRP